MKKKKNKCVYFIRCGDFVKIGFTGDVDRRISEISLLSPHVPVLEAAFPGAKKLENRLHQLFAVHHVRQEWFHWCDEIAAVAANGLPDLSHIPPKPMSLEIVAKIRRSHQARLKASPALWGMDNA